jgi:glycosyltransferase involved in cell wall biosynthesis
MKQRIVLSGVNITTMGAMAVYKDALQSLASEYANQYEIVALVHDRLLFDIPHVKYLEFPGVKTSKLRRLKFEFWDCRAISRQLNPYLWFALHDITPSVSAVRRAVYCQNAVSSYRVSLRDALVDRKFGLYTLLYGYVYGLNIRSNDFVVVQHDWFRSHFHERYGLDNVVVARPSVEHLQIPPTLPKKPGAPYCFFYPSYPWYRYKNFEQILRTARVLEQEGANFELWLTTDGSETRYATGLLRDFADLKSVRWLGLLPRSEVLERYAAADCLLFPSRLESWGMPITEFKRTGKPILAADLSYAHETVGDYAAAAFFDVDSDPSLIDSMRKAISGLPVFAPSAAKPVPAPFARNWSELWQFLLGPLPAGK